MGAHRWCTCRRSVPAPRASQPTRCGHHEITRLPYHLSNASEVVQPLDDLERRGRVAGMRGDGVGPVGRTRPRSRRSSRNAEDQRVHDGLGITLPLIDLRTQERRRKRRCGDKSSCVQVFNQGTIQCVRPSLTPRLTSRVATDKQYTQSTNRCQPGAEAEKLTATEPGRTVAACNLAWTRGV